jgi:hypothetical protein
MELFLKKFLLRRGILALCPLLVIGLAPQGLAQSTVVSSYITLFDALAAGSTNITNFSTGSTMANPVVISLSFADETLQITTNVTIDAGTNYVVFQGNGAARFFDVHPNATLTLNNLEFTNGLSSNGGAIFNEGTLIISNCLLTGNTATNTNGIVGGSGLIGGLDTDGTNGGDGGMASGGAIYSTGPVFVSYSIFTNNFAEAGYGGNGGNAGGESGSGGDAGSGGNAYGGAVFCTGSSNIFYMTEFVGNGCLGGNGGTGGTFAIGPEGPSGFGGAPGLGGLSVGGAAFIAGPLYMTNCFVYSNYARAGGPGAAEVDSDGNGYYGGPGSTAVGGGLFVTNGVTNASIENTIIFFNVCYGGFGGSTSLPDAYGGNGGEAAGGGIYSAATLMRMNFCTVATNYVFGGAGGTNTSDGPNGTNGGVVGWGIYHNPLAGVFELGDSILAGDSRLDTFPNASSVTDEGYNISSDASLVKNTIITNTLLNTTNLDFLFFSDGNKVGGSSFGSYMLTLALTNNPTPAEGFVPGIPGLTFPATDEALLDRRTPTSAGAYELNNLPTPLNPVLPTIISTLPLVNLTGNGGTVSFTNTVDTTHYTGLPYGYQWQFNGTNIYDGTNFSGTVSNILTVKKITIANQGQYTCLVSPTLLIGAATSGVVELALTNPPSIKTQPVSQLNRPAGSIVTFTVDVLSPLNFGYQWILKTTNATNVINNGGEYSGATSNVLTIDPATAVDEGTYSVVVTNTFGSTSTTSAPVRLTIVPDHTRPTVTILSPLLNARTNALVIKGTASDNAQVTNVTYTFTNINNGVTNTQVSGTATFSNISPTLNGLNEVAWSTTNLPLPGSNTLAVQSEDYSSNLSITVNHPFFYEVTNALALTIASNGGSGRLTSRASIPGNTIPSNGAALNIGEGYVIVATPTSAASLLGNWTITNGPNVTITNGATLKFIMESNTAIQALFISNSFLATGVYGVYNGLFYVTNGAAFESSGMLDSLVLGTEGAFTARLLLAGGSYILDGAFNAFGHFTNNIVRTEKEGGNLTVEMDVDTNGGGVVTGTVTNAAWPTNAVLAAGLSATAIGISNYTLLMAPLTNAPTNVPVGDGYALLSERNGTVILSGGLADGTTFSQSVPASRSNDIPVYVSLYTETGFLFGWLNLTNLDNTNLADELLWIKGVPAHPSLLFSNGFTNVLLTAGSIWTNPGTIMLAASTNLIISNADLNLSYNVAIKDKYELFNATNTPTNSLTGTINLTTGLMSITFGNGDGRLTTIGYGAMLQNTNFAGGYFVTKTNTGSIILQP